METKLYNHLKKELIEKNIDFSNLEIQKQVENLSQNSLGLEQKYINKIIRYLKTYNTFLILIGKKEIKLRYYQILALYFSEMYFDKKDTKELEKFSNNALAYWMATGSGKTIVMHLNILQYIDKLKNYNTFQVILTTPGVNLIEQHKEEIKPFIDYLNYTKYNNKINFIIDTTSSLVNKGTQYYSLAGNKKTKRLILIDEAHIGTTSTQEGVFYKFRNNLNKENSFLFEYSATYHNLGTGLINEYENQIIYDYNYNLFYKDGYGKDFSFKQVGNDILAGETENELKQNLDKCLSVISEKIDIWSKISDYNHIQQISLFGNIKMFPDKPLITFMGNTVNTKDTDEISDILNIVKYLANLELNEKSKFKNIFNNQINGKLTITRNKSIKDELLLSYGDNGKYFGIINVGNGDKFFNDIDFKNIDKKTIEIIDTKYLFKNIDKKQSPINLLIGSRKFAEGWNSFRVSVIALINLGSNIGNKIIQIFGRGVRLKGLAGDGKRKYKKHQKDYFELNNNNEEDKLKKIETLNILSVKKSYLEKFTKNVNEDIKITHSFKIKVSPNLIKLNNGEELNFEKYKKNLPIFKLSKKEIYYKKVIIDGNSIYYSYVDNGKIIENERISNFKFSLDYRVDRSISGINIKEKIIEKLDIYESYIDMNNIKKIIIEYIEENKINIYSINNKELIDFDIKDIFNFIDEIKYDNFIGNDLLKIEKTIIIIINDFLKKLKNKINHRINSKNIVYDKELTNTEGKGDFIEEYIITKEFKTEQEKSEYISNLKEEKRNILNTLSLDFNKHIYKPLLIEEDFNKNLGISIFPDKLNPGERVFIEQLKEYIDTKNKNLDHYLLRNIESLRSIGIYLENDEHPFFPDFVLWIIDKKKIYINFIDPKGQDGIFDRDSGIFNDKAKIGNKKLDNTLKNIEKEINKKSDKKIILNSYILLKPDSKLGTTNNDNIQEKMLESNVFKMDWYGSNLLKGKSYLDMLFKFK